MSSQTYEAVIWGALSVDAFEKVGVVSPGYEAGGKDDLPNTSPEAIQELLHTAESLHSGGNGPNAGEHIARQPGCKEAYLATGIAPEGDIVSDTARSLMGRSALNTSTVQVVPDHRVSVGRIERDVQKGPNGEDYIDDRMVWGLGRGKLNEKLSDAYIHDVTRLGDLVLVASMKEVDLTERIFLATDPNAILSYNPGGKEFSSHPQELRRLMREYRPTLLALNKQEGEKLVDAPKGSDSREVIEACREFADNILLTDGMEPVLLQTPEELYAQRVVRLPRERVVSTLGAGDRSHGVVAHGLAMGQHPREILQRVVASTANVIQRDGAWEDYYNPVV